mgnify:CR=1 FL=1|jgi:hypothetical protein
MAKKDIKQVKKDGKRSKKAKPAAPAPQKVEAENASEDFGGMNMDNFRRNLGGCG